MRTEAEGWLAIRCDFIDRQMLLQAAPHVFHLSDHYRNHPAILLDVARSGADELLDILERAWRITASGIEEKALDPDYTPHLHRT